jgi:hypothetical protein
MLPLTLIVLLALTSIASGQSWSVQYRGYFTSDCTGRAVESANITVNQCYSGFSLPVWIETNAASCSNGTTVNYRVYYGTSSCVGNFYTYDPRIGACFETGTPGADSMLLSVRNIFGVPV